MTDDNELILKPIKKEIETLVKVHEEEWKFATDIIYNECLQFAKKINLCIIDERDIKGPIRTYLLIWGNMGRVLNTKRRSGWDSDLLGRFRDNCKDLNKYKSLKIETTNLNDSIWKKQINKHYEMFNAIIASTATGKLLHLLFPDFFPLWDSIIRKQIFRELGNKEKKEGKKITPKSYFKFMKGVSEFIIDYNEIIIELSEIYQRPKLKIVDEYFLQKIKKMNR
ncbi:MAG: hypothetical protein ACFFCM_20720 [Promethearchaeota archaeon]